jgi:U3 small nucleolar RNA-associated protein 22
MSLTKAKRKRAENDDAPPRDLDTAERSSEEASSENEDRTSSTQQTSKRAKRNASRDSRQLSFVGGTYVGELYGSNMFKLQVDALLDQLKPNIRSIESTINNVLRDLKSLIESIPEREPILVCNLIAICATKRLI